MAKKTAKAAGSEDAKGADALQSVTSPNSGVPLHSFEASRGPIETGATTAKEAFGIEDQAATVKTGKPVRIKARVPRYTAHGKVFRNDDEGPVYFPGDFTTEQWAGIRSNPNLIVSKAVVSDE